VQVGYVGLLKAINNFGPAFGRSLAVCARPCIADQHRMPSSPPGLSSRGNEPHAQGAELEDTGKT
jgi:hypothetical protein